MLCGVPIGTARWIHAALRFAGITSACCATQEIKTNGSPRGTWAAAARPRFTHSRLPRLREGMHAAGRSGRWERPPALFASPRTRLRIPETAQPRASRRIASER